MEETITISVEEYKELLSATVGVKEYIRASKIGMLTWDAHEAAKIAVENAYQHRLAKNLANRELETHR